MAINYYNFLIKHLLINFLHKKKPDHDLITLPKKYYNTTKSSHDLATLLNN